MNRGFLVGNSSLIFTISIAIFLAQMKLFQVWHGFGYMLNINVCSQTKHFH